MKKTFFLFSFLFCLIFGCSIITAKGQSLITGNVKDSQNKPFLGALVMILDVNDYIISSEITDSTGTFSMLLPVNLDNHWLLLSSFGYQTKKIELVEAIKQKDFVLEDNLQILKEVVN